MARKKRNVDLSSKDWNIIEENISKYSDDIEVKKALRCQVERLTARMDELQISQDELCKKIGISQGAMSNYTSGNRLIDVRILPKIAKELNISIDYLFGYSEVKDYSYNEINKLLGLNDESIKNIRMGTSNKNLNLIFNQDYEFIDMFFIALDDYAIHLKKIGKDDSSLLKTAKKIKLKEKKLVVVDAFNDLLEENAKVIVVDFTKND